MKSREKLGLLLLGIWLILEGIIRLTSMSALGIIMGLLALAAGVLLLLANIRSVRI